MLGRGSRDRRGSSPRSGWRAATARRLAWTALSVLALAGLLPLGLSCAVHELGGDFARAPAELEQGASPALRALLGRAFADLDPSEVEDHHVHVVGLGREGSGCWVNPRLLSWAHPLDHLRLLVFASAAQVELDADADRRWIERLVALSEGARPPWGRKPAEGSSGVPRRLLLAFDLRHDAAGAADREGSEIFVPASWPLAVAAEHPALFGVAGSVHPYRADALEALDALAARGVRWIKWLPNSMGIDPADARCDAFYERMRAHGMALLSHAGAEQAVDAAELQELGNPLRLRRALEHGVQVVVAHCASLGTSVDLDDPQRARRTSFELFLRMMDEPRWRGLLFGEISGVTQHNRRAVLAPLLARADLHPRLVDGTDYPIPAVDVLIWLGTLRREGFLEVEERAALAELYDYNPLLFDLALKRTVHHPESGARFPASIFRANPALPPLAGG